MSFTKNPSKRAVSGSMTNKIPSSQEMKHYDNCCGIHGAARLRKGMKHATVTERRRHEKDVINEQLSELDEDLNMKIIHEEPKKVDYSVKTTCNHCKASLIIEESDWTLADDCAHNGCYYGNFTCAVCNKVNTMMAAREVLTDKPVTKAEDWFYK